MKPIWKASEHVEGPNDCDIYTAAIDITESALWGLFDKGERAVSTHWSAIEFHDPCRAFAVLKRDAVLELMWASGRVDKGENV